MSLLSTLVKNFSCVPLKPTKSANQPINRQLLSVSLQVSNTPNKPGRYAELASSFKSGDIVYGLDQPRRSALSALKGAGFLLKEASKSAKNNILIQNHITNVVWDTRKPTKYSSDIKIQKTLHDGNRAIDFKVFLSNHKKYNVKDNTMAQDIKAGVNVDTSAVALWKKTSKAGLEFQLLQQKKPVHFIVDEIINTIDKVASKEGYGKSITSAELRWLYRHKDTPEVRENIKFWREGGLMEHSEVFAPEKWANYARIVDNPDPE